MAAASQITAVLEDDPDVRTAMCLLLRDWGYEAVGGVRAHDVLSAVSGEGARIRAIITDFELGGEISGVEEAALLIAAGAGPFVLVVSGGRGDLAAEAAAAAGHVFMAKPARPKALIAWLKTCLSSAG